MTLEITESATVTAPGLYRMSAAEYHAGPCPTPELSCSIAKILLAQSPAHAYIQHPKLGSGPVSDDDPAPEEKNSNILDMGSAIHKLTLGFGADIRVIDPLDHPNEKGGGFAKGWTNKSIKAAREDAYAAGAIPLLPSYYSRARNASEALQSALEDWLGCPISECLREVVVVWQENGCWRKAMFDIATPDLRRIGDVKSTGTSVAPSACGRFTYSQDYDIQTAFYLRGLDAIDPGGAGRREFAFFYGEIAAPFAVSPPIILAEPGLQGARMQVSKACATWDACLASNNWPAYGREPYYADPPYWKSMQMGNGHDL